MDVGVRLVQAQDAAALTALRLRNRAFLAPWEPDRPDAFFTEEHQREQLELTLRRHREGAVAPYVVLVGTGVVGQVTVNDIVRGAFQNGHLGYWVDQGHTGRGVATAAVRAVVRRAFGELGLHRLQAGTLMQGNRPRRVDIPGIDAGLVLTRVGLWPLDVVLPSGRDDRSC